MKGTERFNIQLEKPWVWEGLAPHEDLLGELSECEMGLRRFCFECNHRVSIEIGDEKLDIFLDPDIILTLDGLPQKVLELSYGQKIQIAFPESYSEIELIPVGGEISCTLSKFGHMAKSKRSLLERSQVLGVLRCFLNELVRLAADGGYISPEQGAQFLTEMRTNASGYGFKRKGLPQESIDSNVAHNS
jgi:hypothetical protein